MMDNETTFAIAVGNAGRDAATARAHGIATTESDMIEAALADLWHAELDGAAEIAARYVRYDGAGKPQRLA